MLSRVCCRDGSGGDGGRGKQREPRDVKGVSSRPYKKGYISCGGPSGTMRTGSRD